MQQDMVEAARKDATAKIEKVRRGSSVPVSAAAATMAAQAAAGAEAAATLLAGAPPARG